MMHLRILSLTLVAGLIAGSFWIGAASGQNAARQAELPHKIGLTRDDYFVVQNLDAATFAIGEAGAANAGLFAVAMLAIANKSLAQQLLSFRDEQTAGARAMLVPPVMADK